MAKTSAHDIAAATQRRPAEQTGDETRRYRDLVRLACLAASSHNTQPWKFRLGQREIVILPDFTRRCPVVDPDDGHLFKSLGCAAENLVHAAAAKGHAAHVGFNAEEKAVHIALEPSAVVKASALSGAILRRQNTKLPYDGRMIAAEHRKALEAAGMGQGVRVMLVSDSPLRDTIMDYVRQGNLEQLGDPAFRRELISWLRFNDAAAIRAGDGLSAKTAGQPSLPGWLSPLLLPFVLTGKGQARTDEAKIRSSPLIAVFVAEEDTPAGWVETGRAYERFALQATAFDIRTAFINQPIELRRLRPQLHNSLGLRHETALLMLRVGYGPLAPYSLRRPVEDVIVA